VGLVTSLEGPGWVPSSAVAVAGGLPSCCGDSSAAGRSRSTASRPSGSLTAEPPANRPGLAVRNLRSIFRTLCACLGHRIMFLRPSRVVFWAIRRTAHDVVPQPDCLLVNGQPADDRPEKRGSAGRPEVDDRGADVLAGRRERLVGFRPQFAIPAGVIEGAGEPGGKPAWLSRGSTNLRLPRSSGPNAGAAAESNAWMPIALMSASFMASGPAAIRMTRWRARAGSGPGRARPRAPGGRWHRWSTRSRSPCPAGPARTRWTAGTAGLH